MVLRGFLVPSDPGHSSNVDPFCAYAYTGFATSEVKPVLEGIAVHAPNLATKARHLLRWLACGPGQGRKPFDCETDAATECLSCGENRQPMHILSLPDIAVLRLLIHYLKRKRVVFGISTESVAVGISHNREGKLPRRPFDQRLSAPAREGMIDFRRWQMVGHPKLPGEWRGNESWSATGPSCNPDATRGCTDACMRVPHQDSLNIDSAP
ncbi:MAG: hypothetical protein EPN70_13275 [Paraburkholderia sp.]|nr:MAG: hypothetical protein EPN70_13275 [Paraburkholderia sp.]TAM31289.1 MAG: hypothetical protein EPN59_06290 [Paraburkholderia sp.]